MDTRTKYEKARDAKGMTDYQVAKASGVPDSTLYDWLGRMETKPYATMSLANMARVAAVLDVTLDQIVGDVN